jgi:uncharacterized protein (TIGR02145 family)
MRTFNKAVLLMLLISACITCAIVAGCKKDEREIVNKPEQPQGEPLPPPSVPATPIPDDLVGTWYGADIKEPMDKTWNEGTFQGEAGFKDFRTMVFSKDGKNAVEYTSEVFVNGQETLKQLYKLTGSLEYKENPSSLVFHAQSGKIRVFSTAYSGYKESDITPTDLAKYYSVLKELVASPEVLNAKRFDGANLYSVKYKKVNSGTTVPGENSNGDYSAPPKSGSYVHIGSKYFPTVTIAGQEWMSVNYVGAGGINLSEKPAYGTFYKFTDAVKLTPPQGWRLPTRSDYIKLLRSQGLVFDEIFNSTDGADLTSKKLLGKLMSVDGWLKKDGYASNQSGFNALPANVQVTDGTAYGEGTNCVLWTSERDSNDQYLAFKIIQMPSDTYAAFAGYPEGFNPVYAPLRFVRDK